MRVIILEELYEIRMVNGNEVQVYIGRIEIPEDEFQVIFEAVKKDKTDEMGYRNYKKVLKEKGFDIE